MNLNHRLRPRWPRFPTRRNRIHRPHLESWNARTGIHVNRSGRADQILEYAISDGVLSVLRNTPGHSRVARMRSWLLPMAGLRVIQWFPHPGQAWEDEDYYVDVAAVTVDGPVWRLEDHYLDLKVWTGDRVAVVDLDEFAAAVGAGFLDARSAEQALETSHRALAGITAHGHDLNAWLGETYGVELS